MYRTTFIFSILLISRCGFSPDYQTSGISPADFFPREGFSQSCQKDLPIIWKESDGITLFVGSNRITPDKCGPTGEICSLLTAYTGYIQTDLCNQEEKSLCLYMAKASDKQKVIDFYFETAGTDRKSYTPIIRIAAPFDAIIKPQENPEFLIISESSGSEGAEVLQWDLTESTTKDDLKGYEIRFSTDPLFSDNVFYKDLPTNQFSVRGDDESFARDQVIYWSVRALFNKSNIKCWSTYNKFTIISPLTIISPKNKAFTCAPVELSWSGILPQGATFDIRVFSRSELKTSTSPELSTEEVPEEAPRLYKSKTNTFLLTQSMIGEYKKYVYWQVKIDSSDEWSELSDFKILALTQIYPEEESSACFPVNLSWNTTVPDLEGLEYTVTVKDSSSNSIEIKTQEASISLRAKDLKSLKLDSNELITWSISSKQDPTAITDKTRPDVQFLAAVCHSDERSLRMKIPLEAPEAIKVNACIKPLTVAFPDRDYDDLRYEIASGKSFTNESIVYSGIVNEGIVLMDLSESGSEEIFRNLLRASSPSNLYIRVNPLLRSPNCWSNPTSLIFDNKGVIKLNSPANNEINCAFPIVFSWDPIYESLVHELGGYTLTLISDNRELEIKKKSNETRYSFADIDSFADDFERNPEKIHWSVSIGDNNSCKSSERSTITTDSSDLIHISGGDDAIKCLPIILQWEDSIDEKDDILYKASITGYYSLFNEETIEFDDINGNELILDSSQLPRNEGVFSWNIQRKDDSECKKIPSQRVTISSHQPSLIEQDSIEASLPLNLQWKSIDGKYYIINVSNREDFSERIEIKKAFRGSYKLDSSQIPENSGTIYWRVREQNAENCFSKTQTIIIHDADADADAGGGAAGAGDDGDGDGSARGTADNAAGIIWIESNLSIQCFPPTLSWDAINVIADYLIQISLTSDFSNPGEVNEISVSNKTSHPVAQGEFPDNNGLPISSIFWRVKSQSDDGTFGSINKIENASPFLVEPGTTISEIDNGGCIKFSWQSHSITPSNILLEDYTVSSKSMINSRSKKEIKTFDDVSISSDFNVYNYQMSYEDFYKQKTDLLNTSSRSIGLFWKVTANYDNNLSCTSDIKEVDLKYSLPIALAQSSEKVVCDFPYELNIGTKEYTVHISRMSDRLEESIKDTLLPKGTAGKIINHTIRDYEKPQQIPWSGGNTHTDIDPFGSSDNIEDTTNGSIQITNQPDSQVNLHYWKAKEITSQCYSLYGRLNIQFSGNGKAFNAKTLSTDAACIPTIINGFGSSSDIRSINGSTSFSNIRLAVSDNPSFLPADTVIVNDFVIRSPNSYTLIKTDIYPRFTGKTNLYMRADYGNTPGTCYGQTNNLKLDGPSRIYIPDPSDNSSFCAQANIWTIPYRARNEWDLSSPIDLKIVASDRGGATIVYERSNLTTINPNRIIYNINPTDIEIASMTVTKIEIFARYSGESCFSSKRASTFSIMDAASALGTLGLARPGPACLPLNFSLLPSPPNANPLEIIVREVATGAVVPISDPDGFQYREHPRVRMDEGTEFIDYDEINSSYFGKRLTAFVRSDGCESLPVEFVINAPSSLTKVEQTNGCISRDNPNNWYLNIDVAGPLPSGHEDIIARVYDGTNITSRNVDTFTINPLISTPDREFITEKTYTISNANLNGHLENITLNKTSQNTATWFVKRASDQCWSRPSTVNILDSTHAVETAPDTRTALNFGDRVFCMPYDIFASSPKTTGDYTFTIKDLRNPSQNPIEIVQNTLSMYLREALLSNNSYKPGYRDFRNRKLGYLQGYSLEYTVSNGYCSSKPNSVYLLRRINKPNISRNIPNPNNGYQRTSALYWPDLFHSLPQNRLRTSGLQMSIFAKQANALMSYTYLLTNKTTGTEHGGDIYPHLINQWSGGLFYLRQRSPNPSIIGLPLDNLPPNTLQPGHNYTFRVGVSYDGGVGSGTKAPPMNGCWSPSYNFQAQ